MSEAEQAQDPVAPESDKPGKPAKTGSGGSAMGAVAAVLGLAAIAASGYVWTEVQKLQSLPQQMQAGAGRTDQLRGEVGQRLQSLNLRIDEESAAAAEMQATLATEVAAAAELALRMEQLAAQVDSLTGTDRSQRNRFLKAEARYFLQIANARALLASDAQVAAAALQLADDKLRETGDPKLNQVRSKLAEELAALRAIPELDVTGVTFRLQSLANQSGDWPLRNPAPDSFRNELPAVADSDASGASDAWSRFKATVAGVFASIVSVRDNSERPDVQLDSNQYALVIESVRAELQLARLAFVTGEFGLFEQSLAQTDSLINGYFNTDNSAVAAALQTLAELRAIERPPAMPDISGSLALLLETDALPAAAGDGSQ